MQTVGSSLASSSLAILAFVTLSGSLSCIAQSTPPQDPSQPDITVIHATSNLVYLDVTVVDDNGKPVVKGLQQKDFVITEEKKPQTVTSFEEPDAHFGVATSESPDGKTPAAIYVLDLLNEPPEEIAYYRYELDRYFKSLPAKLTTPTEFFALGNQSLELLQGFTLDRDELIQALHRLPASVPYKYTMPGFGGERFVQSVDAIQQMVVQNSGIEGRKNIFWLGTGSPTIDPRTMTGDGIERLKAYIHETVNMLVAERIALYVYYPGLKVRTVSDRLVQGNFAGAGDPFSTDVSFGALVNESGGALYYDRNDIDAELKRSLQRGSQFYTLTYQPKDGVDNGKFRRVHVEVTKYGYHAITKQGYFAPEKGEVMDTRREQIVKLGAAARATIPMSAIPLKLSKIVRHADTQTVEIAFVLPAYKLKWQPGDPGTSRASIRLAAAGFSGSARPVVWKVEDFGLKTGTADPQQLAKGMIPVSLTVALPAKLKRLRILLEPEDLGELGSLDLDRKQIDAAPDMPSPVQPPTAASAAPRPNGAQ
jgi:VWFA-related protein